MTLQEIKTLRAEGWEFGMEMLSKHDLYFCTKEFNRNADRCVPASSEAPYWIGVLDALVGAKIGGGV